MAIASVVIMLIAALAGFLLGTGINAAETTAILFAMVAGFACTIYMIENKGD